MKNTLQYLTATEKRAVDQFVQYLRTAMGPSLVKMELFGSKARGTHVEASDIDILVVVRERTLEAMDKLAEITARLNIEYGLSLSPVVFSELEYKINADMASPFSVAVEAEGVLL